MSQQLRILRQFNSRFFSYKISKGLDDKLMDSLWVVDDFYRKLQINLISIEEV